MKGELLLRLFKKRAFVRTLRSSLVLRTIRKSGTNYLRLLLTNYVINLDAFQEEGESAFQRVSYDEMHHRIFPNVRVYIWDGEQDYKAPDRSRGKRFFELYEDLLYDHGCLLDKWSWTRPKMLVYLYRNPLDQILSLYHYKQGGKVDPKEGVPMSFIEEQLDRFMYEHAFMKRVCHRMKDFSVMLSYEELFLDPSSTLSELLAALGLPVHDRLIELSLDASSRKRVKEEEKERGEAIHQPGRGLTGSFVRSGEVGQWKDGLPEGGFEVVEKISERYKVPMSDFCFDRSEFEPRSFRSS